MEGSCLHPTVRPWARKNGGWVADAGGCMEIAMRGKRKKKKGERAGILCPPWLYLADMPGKIKWKRTSVMS